MRGKRYSDEVKAKALATIDELGSISKAVQSLGMPQSVLYRWHRIANGHVPTVYSRKQKLRIAAYARKHSAKDASIKYEVNASSVRYWMRGINLCTQGYTSSEMEQIKCFFAEHGYALTVDHFKISGATLCAWRAIWEREPDWVAHPSARYRLTDEDKIKAVDLANATSVKKAAQVLGLPINTLYYWRKQYGVPPPDKSPALLEHATQHNLIDTAPLSSDGEAHGGTMTRYNYSKDVRKAAVKLAVKIGAARTCAKLGMSQRSVRSWCVDAGVTPYYPKPHRSYSAELRAAAASYAAIHGVYRAHEKYNVACSSLRKWMRDPRVTQVETAKGQVPTVPPPSTVPGDASNDGGKALLRSVDDIKAALVSLAKDVEQIKNFQRDVIGEDPDYGADSDLRTTLFAQAVGTARRTRHMENKLVEVGTIMGSILTSLLEEPEDCIDPAQQTLHYIRDHVDNVSSDLNRFTVHFDTQLSEVQATLVEHVTSVGKHLYQKLRPTPARSKLWPAVRKVKVADALVSYHSRVRVAAQRARNAVSEGVRVAVEIADWHKESTYPRKGDSYGC